MSATDTDLYVFVLLYGYLKQIIIVTLYSINNNDAKGDGSSAKPVCGLRGPLFL